MTRYKLLETVFSCDTIIKKDSLVGILGKKFDGYGMLMYQDIYLEGSLSTIVYDVGIDKLEKVD